MDGDGCQDRGVRRGYRKGFSTTRATPPDLLPSRALLLTLPQLSREAATPFIYAFYCRSRPRVRHVRWVAGHVYTYDKM